MINLAGRDIRYHLGRFLLTGLGIGLLLATVMAMGGIMNAQDALEFIITGAHLIAVGTANFVNPSATMEILEGIKVGDKITPDTRYKQENHPQDKDCRREATNSACGL